MLRFAAILLTIALAALSAGPARAIDSADSTRIILLLVVVDDKAKDDIKSWINLFQNNVQGLLDDFSFGGSGAGRGIKVDVVRKDVKEPAKRNELEASFEQQPSLQVLSTVGTAGGNSTLVDNEIYLGDFKGSLNIPYVHFAQTVVPSQFKITREALVVVTFYAYAMAIAKTSPPDRSRFAVCQVLDRANMYRNSDLDPEARGRLENLFTAISTELEARACGGKKN